MLLWFKLAFLDLSFGIRSVYKVFEFIENTNLLWDEIRYEDWF